MSKKYIAEQETKIKDSLFEFVKTHIPDADLNFIDEIVLSYVIAVLEDVGTEPVFDVEGIVFFLLLLKISLENIFFLIQNIFENLFRCN